MTRGNHPNIENKLENIFEPEFYLFYSLLQYFSYIKWISSAQIFRKNEKCQKSKSWYYTTLYFNYNFIFCWWAAAFLIYIIFYEFRRGWKNRVFIHTLSYVSALSQLLENISKRKLQISTSNVKAFVLLI